MVFKHLGTWIEVLNHFEKLLVQEMDFLRLCEMITNVVLLERLQ